MPSTYDGDPVFQRTRHSAIDSKTDQLVHKQRNQITSAHHTKPLREKMLTSSLRQCSARVETERHQV
jgi:hypothetical protein